MGSFFNGGGSRAKPRYQRLPLDTFYLTESTDINHKELDEDNTLFELGDLGQKGPLLSTKNGYDSQEEIEFYKDTRTMGRRRKKGCSTNLCRLTVVLILIVCAVVILSGIYVAGSGSRSKLLAEKNWSSSLFDYSTETVIRLYDVNLDGIQDVILGASTTTSLKDVFEGPDYCKRVGMEYPCAGRVIALNGRDGTTLWDIGMEVEIFAIQCGKVDINGDGHMDCIVAGRMASLHGIDPIKGKRLWSADPDVTNPHFNYYQGQVVPDLNGDGVPDYVVAHGGDTRLTEEDSVRPSGRLLLLSGKTGKSLGRYLVMPDARECYSAITLYERANGAIYVLFGSGGETISGSFWAMSLRDLYCHVMSIESCDASHLAKVSLLQSVGYNEPWGSPLRTLPSGIMEVLRSGSSKGVSVPTEVVDINNDGTDDLIVFMYNSTIVALDGTNLAIIWSTGQRFEDFETYSNPAPGYFNDDDTLDLMVRLNKGKWSAFSGCYVFILDGRTGETLWSIKTSISTPVMSSPLTIQSHGYKDAFLVWIQGRYSNPASNGRQTAPSADDIMEVPSSDLRHRRHDEDEETVAEQPCQRDMSVFKTELLLIDRDLARNPLKLAEMNPAKYNYTLTDEDRELLKSDSYHHPIPPPSPNQPALPTTEGGTVTEEDIARHGQLDKATTVAASTMAVTIPEVVETAAATPVGQKTPSTTLRAEITTVQTDRMTTVNHVPTTADGATKETSTIEEVKDLFSTTVVEEKEKTGSTSFDETTPETTTHVSTTETLISHTTDYTTTEAKPYDNTTTTAPPETTELTTAEMSGPTTNDNARSTSVSVTQTEMITTGIETTAPMETTSSTSQDATTQTRTTLGEEGYKSDSETTTSAAQTIQETEIVTEIDWSDTTTVPGITTSQTLSLSHLNSSESLQESRNESEADPLRMTSTNRSLDSNDTAISKGNETDTKTEELGPPQDDAGSSPDQKIPSVTERTKNSEDGDKERRRRETPGGDLCTVRIPCLLGTGTIGDLDGDGNLEYIYAETLLGKVMDEKSSYIKEKISLVIKRLVLNTAIKREEWSRVEQDKGEVYLSNKVRTDTVIREEIAEHFQFLPAEKQSWTGYMGKGADGTFKKSGR
ncbi:uncharacterized protein LOC117292278 [Asterias rubens]|uniref:uncharacterized protein LOC117292278 n=1 Tax=Asterias rubens TaxID=7604 RepID=UPI00145557AF|nr:uncharacterized protein LOC117292278 [Asterias rubens]